MKKMIKTHLIAAVLTVAAYRWMTGEDGSYIMAMMAMYIWFLAATVATRWWLEERRENHHDRSKRDADGGCRKSA